MVLEKCINCQKFDNNHNCLDNQKNPAVSYNYTNFEVANEKLLVPPQKSINDFTS